MDFCRRALLRNTRKTGPLCDAEMRVRSVSKRRGMGPFAVFRRAAGFAATVMLVSGWLPAAPVTQADLDAALSDAKKAWMADLDVSVRFEEMKSCETARVGQSLPPGMSAIAFTRRLANKNGSEAPAWVIEINSACEWTPWYVRKVVLHEYGHALGLEHSNDPHSVMFWLVFSRAAARNYGAQKITAADLRRVDKLRATE